MQCVKRFVSAIEEWNNRNLQLLKMKEIETFRTIISMLHLEYKDLGLSIYSILAILHRSLIYYL